ncbi:MAG TPA: ATP-binding protein [Polyangiaceae bacterium]|nr:ATP-binding protein [Polyangiaceae bacterium]
MPQFLTRPFGSDAFVTLGHCRPWKPGLVWVQLVSDLLIALACASVPVVLVQLMRKRRDVPFKGILLSFAIFLVACAATHALEVWSFWKPTHWVSAAIEVMAAALSVTTAVCVTRLLPAALATPPLETRRTDRLRDSDETGIQAGGLGGASTTVTEGAGGGMVGYVETVQDAFALYAAEEANAATNAFLSCMSHELRTPLNAILGFAQLLRKDESEPLSERHRERIDRILSGGEHLSRLIDDVLDLSRIEGRGLSLSIEPVSISDVLEQVKSELAPAATKSGIAIEVEPSAQPPLVSADRARVAQILLNLGSNGVKYNRPAGRVTFVVSTPRPEVVRILVRDTGIGIPVGMQRKMFQPFHRAGQEMGSIQGSGMGLVIARRLALLMGGDVDFRSVAGDGSEFWVDLPKHSSTVRATPSEATHRLDTASRTLQMRKLVLYVEDNPANVMFMEDLASTLENVELVSAPTAEVGVDVARRRRPQVVIMDINLPGMNGIEALRTLRSVPETRDVPVIALTAAASQRDRERGVQAGFHRYLTKPVKVTELVTTLESLFAPVSADSSWSTSAKVAIGSDPQVLS